MTNPGSIVQSSVNRAHVESLSCKGSPHLDRQDSFKLPPDTQLIDSGSAVRPRVATQWIRLSRVGQQVLYLLPLRLAVAYLDVQHQRALIWILIGAFAWVIWTFMLPAFAPLLCRQ